VCVYYRRLALSSAKWLVAELRGPVLKAFSVWCVTRALITFLKKRRLYVSLPLFWAAERISKKF
jgi:hypothetical protein